MIILYIIISHEVALFGVFEFYYISLLVHCFYSGRDYCFLIFLFLRVAPLSTGSRFLHGVEQAPSYTFHSQSSGSSHLTQRGSGRSPIASALTDHEGALSNINASTTPIHGQLGIPQVAGFESPLASPERLGYHDEDTYHMDRKRKVCSHCIYGYIIFLLLYYYIHILFLLCIIIF